MLTAFLVVLSMHTAVAPAVQESRPAPEPGGQKNIAMLIERLKSPDARQRGPAIEDLALEGDRAMPALRAVLRGEDLKHRYQVLQVLVLMGVRAKQALPELIPILGSDNFDMKGSTLAILYNIGPAAAEALPELARLLDHENPRIRHDALAVAARVSADASRVLPLVFRGVADEADVVRQRAAELIASRYGELALEALEPLLGMFESANEKTRSLAIKAVAKLGPKAWPRVQALARDEKLCRRLAALQCIGHIRPVSEAQVGTLLDALAAEEKVREIALNSLQILGSAAVPGMVSKLDPSRDSVESVVELVEALGLMGGAAAPAVPRLAELLAAENARIRKASAHALIGIGKAGSAAFPALRKALRDPSEAVRAEAVTAIGLLGPVAREVLPELVGLLANGTQLVSHRAVACLRQLGATAAPAVASLIELLPHDDQGVRVRAILALAGIGQAAVPALLEALGDVQRPGRVRRGAAQAFGEIGSAENGVLEALIKAARSEDVILRMQVAQALSRLGARARPAEGTLRGLLADRDKDVRLAAANALGFIGKRLEKKTIQLLIDAIKGRDRPVGWGAIESLGRILDPVAIPALVEALESHDKHARWRAAQALGRFGAAASSSLPALEKLSRDTEYVVALEAEKAIKLIRGR
ncbi:MAG: HEAT repeat domain-containing protein [Planctomycetota bacterium]